MIEILQCELDSQIGESPIFEVKGIYDGEEFTCRVEMRFGDFDLDDLDYEHVDGPDLGPEGYDLLEDLVNELLETDEYQEASEEFEKEKSDPDVLFD